MVDGDALRPRVLDVDVAPQEVRGRELHPRLVDLEPDPLVVAQGEPADADVERQQPAQALHLGLPLRPAQLVGDDVGDLVLGRRRLGGRERDREQRHEGADDGDDPDRELAQHPAPAGRRQG